MKKLMLTLLICCFFSIPLLARPLAEEAGWEFSLSLNGGYVNGLSNLSVSDDNETISSLDAASESVDSVIVYPFARIQYTTEDLKTQLFIGNSREQISNSQFQYELGFIHQFNDKSKLTAAYFPELPIFNDAWQDPFLVGEARVKTDDNAQGGRIQLERIAGGPITLKYAYAQREIENDQSGQNTLIDGESLTVSQLQSLQRSSLYHRFAIETMFPVYSKVFLKPTLQYTARLADGDAISHDDYNFQLALLIFRGRHTLITSANIGRSLYKQENPIFSEKQDSTNIGLFSVYSYAQAFNYQPLTFSVIAGYNQKQSDIDFYDEKGFIVSTGLAYTF